MLGFFFTLLLGFLLPSTGFAVPTCQTSYELVALTKPVTKVRWYFTPEARDLMGRLPAHPHDAVRYFVSKALLANRWVQTVPKNAFSEAVERSAMRSLGTGHFRNADPRSRVLFIQSGEGTVRISNAKMSSEFEFSEMSLIAVPPGSTVEIRSISPVTLRSVYGLPY